ncbi:hypothetical protein FJY71_06490, partial [candidate division WOR-3 bacterium]|nr:hypothetical protein [candidate division WOR-3 bacterium]
NRLIVVDSLRTRQSGFAHQFIQVTPGTEPFALLALAALVDSKLVRAVDVDRMAALAGVERSGLEAAARTLALDLPAFVGTAMHFGRVYHPALQSLSAQLVARAAQCPFMGFREAALPAGTMKFSDLRRAIGAGRIRMVFWTGGLFPYSYAELMPELAKVEFLVATAIFAPNPPLRGLVLPLAAELERQSSGGSYWGPVERKPLAAPLSGTREFGGVLGWFGRAAEAPEPAAKPAAAADVVAAAEKAAGQVHLTDGTLLLGEKTAIGLRGFYDGEDELRLHPADAAILGLAGRDVVAVKSPAAEVEFRVRVTDAVQTGTAAAGVNVHRNRALFPLAEEDMTGEATVPPVRVSVTKTGRTARSGGESPSVWT